MNKKNLQALIDQLESEKGAKRGIGFNMGTFLAGDKVDTSEESGGDMFNRYNPCGTVACIAGHAAIMAKPHRSIQRLYDDEYTNGRPDIQDLAKDWLGLDSDQAKYLFYAENSDIYISNLTLLDALTVLKKLRDTGEVDWTLAKGEVDDE